MIFYNVDDLYDFDYFMIFMICMIFMIFMIFPRKRENFKFEL